MPLSSLADLPDSVLWTSRTWPELGREARRRRGRLVLLPVCGLADWGLGRPLDLEETLGSAVLRAALVERPALVREVTVLPPLRWTAGPYPHTAFGLGFETALELLMELAASVHASGFRRLVLFNTSPWNEELVEVAGRDARVSLGLQVFLVNLAALGLDLHPVRSADRTAVQCAACACYGALPPAEESAREDVTLPDFRPGNVRQPGPLPFTQALASARTRGTGHLADAGRHLAALIAEMQASAPLAHAGRIPALRAPRPLARGAARRRRRS